MFTSKTTIRVRYSETDKMGVVYHGNYAQYLEVARTDALRQVGLTYKSFEDNGIMMPVLSLNCKFLKSAFYDDELTIITTIKTLPTIRIHFFYEIFNPQNELITTAEVELVNIDMKTNKLTKAPSVLIDALKPFFN
ncbi:MAG: thioesterase family protein [Bacteroidota bacterium]|jgi:acyl-CoA thioester hydrolase